MEKRKREEPLLDSKEFSINSGPQRKKIKETKQEETTTEALPAEIKQLIFYFAAREADDALLSLALVCKEWHDIAYDPQTLQILANHNLSKTNLKFYNRTKTRLNYCKDAQTSLRRLYMVRHLRKTKAMMACMRLLNQSDSFKAPIPWETHAFPPLLGEEQGDETTQKQEIVIDEDAKYDYPNPFLVLKTFDLLKNKKSINSMIKGDENSKSFLLLIQQLDTLVLKTCTPLYKAWRANQSEKDLSKAIYSFIKQTYEVYEHLAETSFSSTWPELTPILEGKCEFFPEFIFSHFPLLKNNLIITSQNGALFTRCQRNLEMSALCNLEMSGLGGERYPQVHQPPSSSLAKLGRAVDPVGNA
ncbi:MAG TPA: F-box protein, partial [Alphaproteobacteria bacterium]|nr:F-box protein [Alphaproteobacteria bacterium]